MVIVNVTNGVLSSSAILTSKASGYFFKKGRQFHQETNKITTKDYS